MPAYLASLLLETGFLTAREFTVSWLASEPQELPVSVSSAEVVVLPCLDLRECQGTKLWSSHSHSKPFTPSHLSRPTFHMTSSLVLLCTHLFLLRRVCVSVSCVCGLVRLVSECRVSYDPLPAYVEIQCMASLSEPLGSTFRQECSSGMCP